MRDWRVYWLGEEIVVWDEQDATINLGGGLAQELRRTMTQLSASTPVQRVVLAKRIKRGSSSDVQLTAEITLQEDKP